jgi:hypothetical protein
MEKQFSMQNTKYKHVTPPPNRILRCCANRQVWQLSVSTR